MGERVSAPVGERVLVQADGDNNKVVTVSGATVYYGGSAVSATSNDGNVTTGNSVTLTSSKYFISTTTPATLSVADVDASDQAVGDDLSVAGDLAVTGDLSVAGTVGDLEVAGEVGATVSAYADDGSKQAVWGDLDLAAAGGTSTEADSSFLGGMMGNVLGAALTKVHNYVGGLIEHYTIETSNASTYPKGAVLAGIGDGSADANGAVVAYIDGDSAQTNAGAAFKVMSNNSVPGSGFEFGIDLQDASHDGFSAVAYTKAEARLLNDAVVFTNAGVPSNGVTLDEVAGPGSLCIDVTNAKLYINTGTKASSTWTVVGSQS